MVTYPEVPLHKIFMEAGKELGYNVNLDLNGPQRTGTYISTHRSQFIRNMMNSITQ